MNINFAWIDPGSVVGIIPHREDEKIFHLEMGQKEGGFAYARVTIQNPRYGLLWPQDKQVCVIGFDGEPAFKGRLVAMPRDIRDELVTLDFTAAPDDAEEKKQALCDQIKAGGPYDPLFFGINPTLRDLLLAQPSLPCWHRLTGDVVLSDILKGRRQMNLRERFFRDSLQVNVMQEPLAAVRAEIKAEWLQQARGVCELGQHVKNACPRGYLSTLTGDSLERSWWPKGNRQNGYVVEESELRAVQPLDKSRFPASTDQLWQGGEKPRQVRLPMKWYDVHLRLGWSYRQKRRESVRFELKQAVQNLNGPARRIKTLSFNLASIVGQNVFWQPDHVYTPGFVVLHNGSVYRCTKRHQSRGEFNPTKWLLLENHVHVDGQAARSTFFTTERGQRAIAYGLEVARAHLAASARCINISIKADLRDLKGVTLDHTLSIQDSRLPGGTVQGKVTGYRFVVDGKTGERLAEVQIGVAIGSGISTTQALPQMESYCEDGVWQEQPTTHDGIHGRTLSSLCFHIPAGQVPPMGIRHPTVLGAEELVEEVEIMNEGVQQHRHLKRRQYPNNPDLKKVLQEMPTDIRIRLKDLRTQGCLDHNVDVNVLTTWSAPKQIDLAAEPMGGGA